MKEVDLESKLVKNFYENKNMNTPLVSIVTVVYNGAQYLEKTIKSVISQNYKNIEYIIIDGGSSDDTLNIIKKYEEHITYWISEKDDGMYNAINKGFSCANGEILCWLNSDDIYFPLAIQNVVETFNSFNDVEWITGRKVIINKYDQIIKVGCFKSFYRIFIKNGFYRGDAFGTITQETTFWRKSLLEKVGYINEELKVASDFELWTRFSEYAELYSLNTILSGFRSHDGQLSSDLGKYYDECQKVKPLRYKKVTKLFGILFYFISMVTAKNKIILLKNGKIKKIETLFSFE